MIDWLINNDNWTISTIYLQDEAISVLPLQLNHVGFSKYYKELNWNCLFQSINTKIERSAVKGSKGTFYGKGSMMLWASETCWSPLHHELLGCFQHKFGGHWEHQNYCKMNIELIPYFKKVLIYWLNRWCKVLITTISDGCEPLIPWHRN